MQGSELRRLRREKGLTIYDVAAALPVSPAAVSRWENGRRRIHPAFQKLLTAYLRKAPRRKVAGPRSRAGR